MLLIPRFNTELSAITFLILLASVTLVNLITYLIMHAGTTKHSKEGMVYLLGGIGAKFLLYLLLILLFWLITKNLSKPFILTFFALYLVFTIFTAGRLLKLLKNK